MLNREKDHFKASLDDLVFNMGISPDYAKRILDFSKKKFLYSVWDSETKTLFNPAYYPKGYFEGAKPTEEKKKE